MVNGRSQNPTKPLWQADGSPADRVPAGQVSVVPVPSGCIRGSDSPAERLLGNEAPSDTRETSKTGSRRRSNDKRRARGNGSGPAAPRRLSLAHRVREHMEELIRSGQWQVGQRIPPEPELIRHFGVSHNTLREAVQGLIHAGMLLARPGDGTYVTAADRLDAALAHRLQQADLSRILEARLAIEKAIVALAARSRSDEDLRLMDAALARCKQREGDGIEADMAFHTCIAAATRNPILCQIYRVITRYLSQHFTGALTRRQYEPEALELHDRLLHAMREQDADAARHIVEAIVAFDARDLPGTPPSGAAQEGARPTESL